MGELIMRAETPTVQELTKQDIKQYICPQANDAEIHRFLEVCKGNNLNPFLNEAYLIKYGNKPGQIVVGKDFFTKNAQNAPRFSHFVAGIIINRNGEIKELTGSFKDKNDTLVGGWAKVYLKDSTGAFHHTVSMAEYSKPQSTWKTIPSTMIRKVALVQCLREAFPDQLGGYYDTSEMAVMKADKREPAPQETIAVKVESMKVAPKISKEDDLSRVKTGLIHLKFTQAEQEKVLGDMEKDDEFANGVLEHLLTVAKSKDLEAAKENFFMKAWVKNEG